MKLTVQKPLKDNIYSLMRRLGYHFQGKDEERAEMAFSRPARGYPRFHIYLKDESETININLHLDQKKPIYKGAPAHSADYEGENVKEEMERIKNELDLNK
ncbi:MAG: hypothetical protein ABH889_02410 [Candidatus Portnoybacteria bacterium]